MLNIPNPRLSNTYSKESKTKLSPAFISMPRVWFLQPSSINESKRTSDCIIWNDEGQSGFVLVETVELEGLLKTTSKEIASPSIKQPLCGTVKPSILNSNWVSDSSAVAAMAGNKRKEARANTAPLLINAVAPIICLRISTPLERLRYRLFVALQGPSTDLIAKVLVWGLWTAVSSPAMV